MGRIIAVANQKGGVGKTTTTVNLAAGLVLLGKRVLVVDLDPQGNTTSGLGIDKLELERTTYDVLVDDLSIDEATLPGPIEGLYVVPATIDLAGAEIELVPAISRETKLRRMLRPAASEQYDYVFIDCPPSLGLLTINALTAADRLLIPIQCEYYALEGVTQLMNTFRLVQQNLNPELALEGILLTMFDGRTNLSIQVVEEVKRHFRHHVFGCIVPRNVRLSEAPSHGLPVMLYDPKSRGAEVYRELAAEVIERERYREETAG